MAIVTSTGIINRQLFFRVVPGLAQPVEREQETACNPFFLYVREISTRKKKGGLLLPVYENRIRYFIIR